MYIRTCQECGHKQESKPPRVYKGDSWKDLKCRKCKSPALDFGSDGWEYVGGKIVRCWFEDWFEDQE